MPNDVTPYVTVKPGDLISADLFNTVQEDVKQDIAQQIQSSIGGISSVKHADDSTTLGGKTTDQLIADILDRVKSMIPGRTGYMQTFNRLKTGVEKVIKHGLAAPPVVDVYQLDYFPVVCSRGEEAAADMVEYVNFYLYHSSERRIRIPGQTSSVTIEDPDRQAFRSAFKDVLALFNVDTSKDGMTIDELEQAFWKAVFSPPNDEFDPDQFCHSPWFEKCCGELRTIKDLRDRGDWDNIWFKMEPRKTINYPSGTPLTINGNPPPATPPLDTIAPTQIRVVHFDTNTIGMTLLADPVYPQFPQDNPLPDAFKNELKVMVVMKV